MNAEREENKTSYLCPTCRSPIREDMYIELCKLLPDTFNYQDVVKICVKPEENRLFHKCLRGESPITFAEDPCMSCENNEIIHKKGTLVRIQLKETPKHKRPIFTEVHKCWNCKTMFEITTSDNYSPKF